MKKIPRITINRIELCKQPKSGAFRTAILTPFHRMSGIFGFDSPAAKNIQQIVYKINESHYEDLNTRHYLCCQFICCSCLYCLVGLHHPEKKETGIFFKSKKVTGLFLFFPSFFPSFLPSFFFPVKIY